MSETGTVNKAREERLGQMLRAKRLELVHALERQIGLQLGEDALASIDEMTDPLDRSVLVLGQEVEIGVLQLKREELRQVDAALSRLRIGDYGRCLECEAEIEEARLEILPFATLCVDCKRRQEIDERRVEATGRGFRAGFRDVRDSGSDPEDD